MGGGGGLIGGLGGDISVSAPAVSSERVYVYRHNTGRGKSEGPWRGRAEHNYDAKRHVMKVCKYCSKGNYSIIELLMHFRPKLPKLPPPPLANCTYIARDAEIALAPISRYC